MNNWHYGNSVRALGYFYWQPKPYPKFVSSVQCILLCIPIYVRLTLSVFYLSRWALNAGTRSGSLWLWLCTLDLSARTLPKASQFSLEHLVLFVPEEPGLTWISILEICILYLVWWKTFWLKPERSSLPVSCLPWSSWLLGISAHLRPEGGPWWQIFLTFNVPVLFVSCMFFCTACFLASIFPLPFKYFFFLFCLIFFLVFSFPSSLS